MGSFCKLPNNANRRDMKEELCITSTWNIVGIIPTPTLIGIGNINGHTLKITMSNEDNVQVSMLDYYTHRQHIGDYVDQVVALYEQEIALRDALLRQVDLRDAPIDLGFLDGPVGWDRAQWRPYCNEEGISWHLWMNPYASQSLVLSIYLDVDLDPDIESRTYGTDDIGDLVKNAGRYITIEARQSESNKPGVKLFSHQVLAGQVITHWVLKDALAGDPLSLSVLNSYCSKEV